MTTRVWRSRRRYSIGKCGRPRLSQPSRLLVRTVIESYLLTYLYKYKCISNAFPTIRTRADYIVTINGVTDVLPLKAARCDAITNLKCFWAPPPRHQRPNVDRFIYIHYASPPYSARITIYLLPFRKVWLSSVCWPPCATPSNEAECRVYGRSVKSPVLF